jgi:hypothetical protein
VWKIADVVKLVEKRQKAIDNDVDGKWKMGAESGAPTSNLVNRYRDL